MSEKHLRQPGFTSSAFGPFKKKKRKNLKKWGKQKVCDIFIKMN